MTTKNDDVLIKVEGLHKIYGDFHALNGINEEIHKGEVVVVVRHHPVPVSQRSCVL